MTFKGKKIFGGLLARVGRLPLPPRKIARTRGRLPKGLLLIQIDGLSRRQCETAMLRGHMPELSRLIMREGYLLRSFYSGLPSSTPAVQAELFYGVPGAVPSFGFRDRERGVETSMLSRKTATAIEAALSGAGEGLLRNGSSYCNIFTGGADFHRFCLSGFHRGNREENGDTPRLPRSVRGSLLYLGAFFRAAALSAVEAALALFDFVRGMAMRQDLFQELTFIPARIAVCIILREFVKANVLDDIGRGVPVIHANFVGYDEQSHRRGPSSAFAHWTLQGIDAALGALWRKARASRIREYELWIYSDHGQESTLSYSHVTRRGIAEAVARAASASGIHIEVGGGQLAGIMHGRADLVFPGKRRQGPDGVSNSNRAMLRMAGMGPLLHLYFEQVVEEPAGDAFASALIENAAIPLVLRREKSGGVTAWNRNGRWRLPQDAEKITGPNHPFGREIGADLVRVAHHENAGDFILCGWRPRGQAISFPQESGAHAGPGTEETHGFCCLPAHVPAPPGRSYLRPLTLRAAALRYFGRTEPAFSPGQAEGKSAG
jgi:hypothetical protein